MQQFFHHYQVKSIYLKKKQTALNIYLSERSQLLYQKYVGCITLI